MSNPSDCFLDRSEEPVPLMQADLEFRLGIRIRLVDGIVLPAPGGRNRTFSFVLVTDISPRFSKSARLFGPNLFCSFPTSWYSIEKSRTGGQDLTRMKGEVRAGNENRTLRESFVGHE
jgi:hypothetical protein